MAKPRLNRLQKAIHVPDTWEGWVLRVMTAAIALVFAAIWILLGRIGTLEAQLTHLDSKLVDLETYIASSRSERNQFQEQNVARQCRILQELRLPAGEMGRLGC